MESTEESYNISVINANDVDLSGGELVLQKKSEDEGGKVNFDDGVYITIPGDMPKPRHLQFYCKTSMSESAEACDVRLAKVKLPSSSDDKIAWKGADTTNNSEKAAAEANGDQLSQTPDSRRFLLGHEMANLPYRTLLD